VHSAPTDEYQRDGHEQLSGEQPIILHHLDSSELPD
jgi:hypothetical protein